MSITQKMIRDSCRSTWGADWWKTDKLSRKATAALSLAGISYDNEAYPILRISEMRGISSDDYRRLAAKLTLLWIYPALTPL